MNVSAENDALPHPEGCGCLTCLQDRLARHMQRIFVLQAQVDHLERQLDFERADRDRERIERNRGEAK